MQCGLFMMPLHPPEKDPFLSCHHPLILAQRIAFLDPLAHGRFSFGIGAGGVPTDMEMFGVNAREGEHRARTREAIEIILKAWTEDGPFAYAGRYWQVNIPEPWPDIGLGYHMKPYQKPYPPIAVAGSTRDSGTLRLAGEYGWIPMSINFLPTPVLQSHWRARAAGCQTVVNGASAARSTSPRPRPRHAERRWRER